MRFASPPALVLCLLAYCFLVTARAISVERRDDNLPARVPYIFPPPGTNEASPITKYPLLCSFDGFDRLQMRFGRDVLMEHFLPLMGSCESGSSRYFNYIV